jgi:hypothetical protein
VVRTDRPWFFPLRAARDAALQEDLVQRAVHEIVHHMPEAAPDDRQREAVEVGDDLDDPDVDADLDFEQQLYSEDDDFGVGDDTAGTTATRAPGVDPEVTDQPPDGTTAIRAPGTTAQQRRRQRDDEAFWPARRGSSRPPHVHPEVWQTLSIRVRRELAAEHPRERARGGPQDAGTQTGAAAILEYCTAPDSTLGQIVSEAGDTICRYTAVCDLRRDDTLQLAIADVLRFLGAHVMASIPCTAGSSWQKLNLHKGGKAQRDRVRGLRSDVAIFYK